MDYSKEQKARLLRELEFERGIGVNRNTAKDVLKAVHRFGIVTGKCYARLATLARDANLSVSTIRRALDVLHKLNLLDIKQKKINPDGFKHQYMMEVRWDEVRLMIETRRQKDSAKKKQAVESGQWLDYGTDVPSKETGDQVETQSPAPSTITESHSIPVSRISNDSRNNEGTSTTRPRSNGDAVKAKVGEFCDSTKCVDDARRSGASDSRILELVAIFETNRVIRPHWKPGALYHRIKKEPDSELSVLEGWPDPAYSPDQVLRMRRQKAREEAAADKDHQRWLIIRQGRAAKATNERINKVLCAQGYAPIPEFSESERTRARSTRANVAVQSA